MILFVLHLWIQGRPVLWNLFPFFNLIFLFRSGPFLLVCSFPLAVSARAYYPVILLLNFKQIRNPNTSLPVSQEWPMSSWGTYSVCWIIWCYSHQRSTKTDISSLLWITALKKCFLLVRALHPKLLLSIFVKSPHCSPVVSAYVFHTAWTKPREGQFSLSLFFIRPQWSRAGLWPHDGERCLCKSENKFSPWLAWAMALWGFIVLAKVIRESNCVLYCPRMSGPNWARVPHPSTHDGVC